MGDAAVGAPTNTFPEFHPSEKMQPVFSWSITVPLARDILAGIVPGGIVGRQLGHGILATKE